jgi:hypothetical protein
MEEKRTKKRGQRKAMGSAELIAGGFWAVDEIGAEGIGGGGGGRMGVGEARVREQGTGLVQRNLYKSAEISHAQSSIQTFLI